MRDDPSPAREQDTPPKIRQLLERLGIDPRDPWVWLTTDGPVSPDHARLRVDDGGSERSFVLAEDGVQAWTGYQFDLIGITAGPGHLILGQFQPWPDDLDLDIRHMLLKWQESPLYAEYTYSERDGEDLKVGGFLLDYSPKELNQALAGLKLLKDIPVRGRGKKPGDGAYYHTDQALLSALDEAITHVQRSTSRANPDARLVMRRLNYGKTAFYSHIKAVTGKRWRDVAAEYELRGIPRN